MDRTVSSIMPVSHGTPAATAYFAQQEIIEWVNSREAVLHLCKIFYETGDDYGVHTGLSWSMSLSRTMESQNLMICDDGIVDSVLVAARGLPDVVLTRDIVDLSACFLWIGDAYPDIIVDGHIIKIRALAWEIHSGFLSMIFFSSPQKLLYDSKPGPSILPAVLTTWEIGKKISENESYDIDPERVGMLYRFVAALFIFMQQRIVVPHTTRMTRTERRAMKRAGYNDDPHIVTVTLRRERQSDARSTADDGRDVNWSCQWLVSGHWRQQWCPSTQSHRVTWIAPYVKGPEDKPFRPSRRVFKLVR